MLEYLPYIAAGVTVLGGAVTVARLFKRIDAITEGVLGKGAVTDRSGAVIEEAVPSLQARVGALETMMSNGTQEARITAGETRLNALESWRDTHTREATEVAQRLLDHITNHPGEK